ncbi:MAG: hypothetical protein U9Q22_06325 [Candidatus Altiarchaeota archaeon]|nr:hypothetical protein [Candidatus Altiarchaeota archaeon]
MSLFDSIFGKEEKEDMEVTHPEMISLVDYLGRGLGEKFHKRRIGRQQGYLTESEVVGVLPPDTFPPYKSKLNSVTLGELTRCGDYIGITGGTLVNHDIFDRIIKVLDKEREWHTILINKERSMPLIISTKKANIIIAPVIR